MAKNSPMKRPRILIMSRSNYLGIARLPKAFHDAGAEVAGLCYRPDFLAATDFLGTRHFWLSAHAGGGGISKLLDALKFMWIILRVPPDLVILADESSIRLGSFVQRWFGAVLALIAPKAYVGLRRSLPATRAMHAAMMLRFPNQQLAETLGIRCPVAAEISSLDMLVAFAQREGFPVIIKTDHSVAGMGVRICHNESQASQAWHELRPKAHAAAMIVQRYVTGLPAMCAVSMLDGQVMASLLALKTQVFPTQTGPSSIVKFIQNPEMLAAAEKMVRAIQCSGFMSFDFMVEAASQQAWLIECNARPVPISHLGNMALELVRGLGGQGCYQGRAVPVGSELALYPQELLRLAGAVPTSGVHLDTVESDNGLRAAYEHYLHQNI